MAQEIAMKWWRLAVLDIIKDEFKARVEVERKGSKLAKAPLPPQEQSTLLLEELLAKSDSVAAKSIVAEGFRVDADGQQHYYLMVDFGIHGGPKFTRPVSVLEPKAKEIRASKSSK